MPDGITINMIIGPDAGAHRRVTVGDNHPAALLVAGSGGVPVGDFKPVEDRPGARRAAGHHAVAVVPSSDAVPIAPPSVVT